MKTFVFASLLLFLISCNVATAQKNDDETARRVKQIVAQIKRQDSNGDGKISRDEANELLKRNFKRVDRNQDDVIDESEIKRIAETIANRNRRNRNSNRSIQVPESVKATLNVLYRKTEQENLKKSWSLDIFEPKTKSEKQLPAIVFIHGGGWRGGDKASGIFRQYAIHFAQRSYVCFSINYRLIQVGKMPACIQDCKTAIRWIRTNAEKYNVKSDRIGAFGNSAGAHLVAMLALAPDDKQLVGDGPYRKQSSAIQAGVAAAPPTDLSALFKIESGARRLKQIFGEDKSKAEMEKMGKLISPVTHASKNAPPLILVHGGKDRTVPVSQSEKLEQALKQAGAKNVTFKYYANAGHGVFREKQSETLPMMEKFFEKHLK